MELEKSQDLKKYVKPVIMVLLSFAIMFSIGYFIYPDDDYGKNFDIRVDNQDKEANVSFDGRSVIMKYENGNKSILIGNRTEPINFEGRRNDIFAVENEIYMFYFDSGTDYLELLRIEEI